MGFSSSKYVHEEEWLDSGHGVGERVSDKFVEKDYALVEVKPRLDGQPCYEDHPRGFKAVNGYFDEAEVRQAAYYAVFAGAIGHTYGHHSIWSMTTEPKDYFIMHCRDAILRPGAAQMQHLRALMELRPFLESAIKASSRRITRQPIIGSPLAGKVRHDLFCQRHSSRCRH